MTLIIGIGNTFRRDDGAGVYVLEALRQRVTGQSDIQFAQASGEGSRLMEIWRGSDNVILLDAVMRQGSPGKIYHLRACDQSIPSDFFKYSSHAFSVAEAIELSRVLDQMPDEIEIFGVEGEDFGYGDTLTDVVTLACNRLIETLTVKLTRESSGAQPITPEINSCCPSE